MAFFFLASSNVTQYYNIMTSVPASFTTSNQELSPLTGKKMKRRVE